MQDPDFFVIDQWQLQELCKVLRKAHIMMYSEGIGQEHREKVLVEMIPSVADGLQRAMDKYGASARIAVVPKGPYVLTRLRGDH